jgi:hypothetical protein
MVDGILLPPTDIFFHCSLLVCGGFVSLLDILPSRKVFVLIRRRRWRMVRAGRTGLPHPYWCSLRSLEPRIRKSSIRDLLDLFQSAHKWPWILPKVSRIWKSHYRTRFHCFAILALVERWKPTKPSENQWKILDKKCQYLEVLTSPSLAATRPQVTKW